MVLPERSVKLVDEDDSSDQHQRKDKEQQQQQCVCEGYFLLLIKVWMVSSHYLSAFHACNMFILKHITSKQCISDATAVDIIQVIWLLVEVLIE